MEQENLPEKAFRKWQEDNKKTLLFNYPSTVGLHGAANNFDYWCRHVYTGRINILSFYVPPSDE